MAIQWRHYQSVNQSSSGAVIVGTWVQTSNSTGTRVKVAGGYAHPTGKWGVPDSSGPTQIEWPAGAETTGNHAYYPVVGVLKDDDGTTARMSVGFLIPPDQPFNAHVWWEEEA